MNSKPAFHTYFSASMQLRYGHDKPMINEVCSSLSFFLSFFFGDFVSTNHPPHPGDHFFSNNLLQGVCFRTEKHQPDVHQEAVFLFMIQGLKAFFVALFFKISDSSCFEPNILRPHLPS
jgi:hypothetical protein